MTPARLITFPGVYKPRSDTALLSRSVVQMLTSDSPGGSRLLDVCSGTGALAVTAARAGVGDVTAIDVCSRAVRNIRVNAALNGAVVRALRGDLFEPVAHERFDVIVANPPYVPAPGDVVPTRGRARAWDAGADGRHILNRICRQAPQLLTERGVLLLVQSSLADTGQTLRMLRDAGMRVTLAATHRGPLGPIAAARRDFLIERNLLCGDDQEDLVVLRATRT